MQNKTDKEKILLLNGEAVQTLIIAKSLYKSGYEVHLLCDSSLSYGYHTKYAKNRVIVPVGDDNVYLEYVKKYVIDYESFIF